MISVGKITEDIINRSPFIREAMSEDLINISALARKIKPEVIDTIGKEVKDGAIVMAIKRMAPGYYHEVDLKIGELIGSLGDFIVRSDLEDFTFINSPTIIANQSKMVESLLDKEDYFYTFCRGIGESTVIISQSIAHRLKDVFQEEKLKSNTKELASITIKLPTINIEVSGVYYYLLKFIAWEGINIVGVVSTANEITLVLKEEEIDTAFSVLMQLKKSSQKRKKIANNKFTSL